MIPVVTRPTEAVEKERNSLLRWALTIDMGKLEIPVEKSNGSRRYVWERTVIRDHTILPLFLVC